MSGKAGKTATKLAVRHYVAEVWRQKLFTIPTWLLVSIGSVFTTFIPPLVIAAFIRRLDEGIPTLDELMPYLLAFAGIWYLGELLWRAAFVCLIQAETRAIRNLYIRALDELRQKDLGFFHDNFAGSLTKKAIGYGRSFESFMDTLTFNVARYVLPLIFASVVLWRYSPWVVIALFAMTACMVAIMVPLIKRRKKLVDAREVASNHMAGHLADVIGNMDTVQAFAHEDDEQNRHVANVTDFMKKAARSWNYHTLKIDMSTSPVYVLVNVVGLALAVLLSDEAATSATIFVTFNYFTNITLMFWEFNRTYRNLENALADAAQFTELLLTPAAIQDPVNPKPFEVTRGEVDFKHVTFAYDNKTHDPLFSDFNLRIAPGEKVALVGRSGGGKTSITKLLLRFVDINSGELLIDSQNIAHSKLGDVRSSIAYVPQEPSMFHRSIRENIRYGRLSATDEEVMEAAKKAQDRKSVV